MGYCTARLHLYALVREIALDLHEPGYFDLWHRTALAPFCSRVSQLYIMALDRDEDDPSRSQSESSDDSDSQDSDDMPTSTTDAKGNMPARKATDDKVKKAANKDPNRIKRKKARRACENCQRAHLTCSKCLLAPATLILDSWTHA